jgi:cell division protein FtsA
VKVKFGSAWPGENKDNEIVSIPGLEEETKRNFIEKTYHRSFTRVVEIVEQVFTEIKAYGHEDPRKKNCRNCTYWWRSTIKTYKQLVEYITGY